MKKFRLYSEVAVDLIDAEILVEKIRKEALELFKNSCLYELKEEYHVYDEWYPSCDTVWDKEAYHSVYYFRTFYEYYVRPIITLEKHLRKLRSLLAGLKVLKLSRSVVDFKSLFRTKIQFLFKNLDDSHALIFLLGSVTKELLHAIRIRWKKIRSNQQLNLLIQY